MEDTTHIDTLRVQAPEEAAQQVRLRLSTKLGGADLHPPGLAPAQVLLVRELADPDPGRLGVDNAGALLDRTWERAVRGALADYLRRAARPSNGCVPPDAEAILFRDEAEAWACWGREQVAREPSAAGPWWTESLEASSDVPPSPADRSPGVAAVWRARPRLVPAMAAHLAAWDAAVDVLRLMSETETEKVLRTVCTAFDAPPPPTPQAPADRADDEEPAPRSTSSVPDDQSQAEGSPPDETRPDAAPAPPDGPPWGSFVEEAAGARLVNALAQESPAHRQLLGVALALHDRPVTVRSPAFQAAWQAWRQGSEQSGSRSESGEQEAPSRSLAHAQDHSGEDGETAPDRPAGDGDESDEPGGRGRSSREGESSVKGDASPVDDLVLDGDRRAQKEATSFTGEREEAPLVGAYTATDLGGVLYLVNVLDALDLPAAATTPPVGEHVGAWAVLEALARALLGLDEDVLRPNDPLWRVLATLDGRRLEISAGQALADAEVSFEAYRIPSAWLEAPHIEPPIEGWWAVENGRLQVWTTLGCVADRTATDEPAAQAEAEWTRVPNTGPLQRAESSDAMPLAPEPNACTPALARWAARTAPYVRHRLAAALGVDDRTAGWTADLLRAEGKLYTTDTHVDLLLPLDAARIDARVAGLDRSPGWWAAGGRVVRFHFRDADV